MIPSYLITNTFGRDITDKKSILNVKKVIHEQLSPIGGVVNGAMILADQRFSKMPHTDWLKTLKPKVDGSMFLDELYSESDLDFFILMGSISGHLGNRSQTAYAAANSFMSSLIRSRRQRGLVGSIINPGQILGVGYVSNTDEALLAQINDALGCYHVSEQDLHSLFAEGILAGRPEAGRNPDIIAGFRSANPAEKTNIIWYPNTKTWHFIEHFQDLSATASTTDKMAQVPIKEQLKTTSSPRECAEIISTGFIAKLKHKLQLSDDGSVTADNSLTELGVDSLVAVDLRTWLVREVGVDVPILKLLGGSSIGELSSEAAAKLQKAG